MVLSRRRWPACEAPGLQAHLEGSFRPRGYEINVCVFVHACVSMIPFAGCKRCHCIMEKSFLSKESSRCKDADVGSSEETQYSSQQWYLCTGSARGWPDGENAIKMARLLWVRDIEWLPEE